ncbi:hypothetical protein CH281_18805 [Rhodococcus sp. 06-221-2]|uniref:ferredoxin n=1 Tax=Nocardiaceae TaxID=85025 RepID=UPI000B9B1BC5|nr:ferredoxin [Rhodococcus sp. 06-221-2]NIL85869.1 hypothetical protein [Rhodococcus fascians]NIL91522.1 hypothetical protein [Rhodococcus fascians]OZD00426.1 hypothetical protein CH281_18805 [Rhodococcus sp. 06-221-2]
MKIVVENAKCQGHGRCYTEAPAVYSSDEIGYIAQEGSNEVAPGHEPQARIGAGACPEAAIRVVE